MYDIQERLEQAAVAGTNLLEEDFRLKRAMEGLAPLAAASPVFGKISAALEGLLSMTPEGRGGALLDALALVDAVVYTQGKTGCSGTLEPLPHGVGTCEPLTYGQLHPLLEALTGTGSGRYPVIEEIWRNHPEYFSDYRVLPLLVKGLGDSYSTLAEQNRDRLIKLGTVSFPLLKEGFDPTGKREMVYRVTVLDAVAGAAENDFYLAQLPNAKREVRGALISALQYDPTNLPLLLELYQTERKGDNRDRALKALAQMESPEVEEALNHLSQTNWEQAVDTLAHTHTPTASRLTAQLLEQELTLFDAEPEHPLTEENNLRFRKLLNALNKKTGPEVCRVYRHAAALTLVLERPLDDGRQVPRYMRFPHYTATNRDGLLFGGYLAWTLANTLMGCPDRELCTLALELYEQYGVIYFTPALAAQLLCLSSEESYQWVQAQIPQNSGLRLAVMRAIERILGCLNWKSDWQTYTFTIGITDHNDQIHWHTTPIPNLDLRWFPLLAQIPDHAEAVLCVLLSNREVIHGFSPQVLDCLYGRVLQGLHFSRTLDAIHILHAQGWSDWDDFVVKWAKSKTMQVVGLNCWEVFHLLEALPVPPEKKAAQLQKMDQLVRTQKLKVHSYQPWLDGKVAEHIALWKQQASSSTN